VATNKKQELFCGTKNMAENLIGFMDAARVADMPSQNFNYYLKTGKAPSFVIIGDRKFFNPKEVIVWAKELKKNKAKKNAAL
jgi:hypothetical protein